MAASTFALKAPRDGTTLPSMAGAVIYIRVSTKEQTENHGRPGCRAQGLVSTGVIEPQRFYLK
jgi:hypothetical protein